MQPGYMVLDDGVGQLPQLEGMNPWLRSSMNVATGGLAIYAGLQAQKQLPRWTLFVGGGVHVAMGLYGAWRALRG